MIDSMAGLSALNTAYVPFAERGEISPGPETVFSDLMKKAQRSAETSEQVPAAHTAAPSEKTGSGKTHGKMELSKTLPDFDQKLYEQCEALEGFLIKNMLKGMRATVMKSDLVDTGFAGEVYEDMLWDEYAKAYTEKADFGLAEMAYMELTGRRGRFPL
ncbi:MAG: rod-binding protein [Treponema sp.]|jgi:flagellar protein FlgJ|nr:rod-binding protein [Treponema sp.]